jgi:iron complex transport system ATP-binding protein
MSALFALNKVNIVINSAHILKEISAEIQAGEMVGIVGPNGSGKSTLLRTMAGVLVPTSGSVQFDGKEVSTIPRRELACRLAVVPQDCYVAFEYSVLEVVLMGRTPHIRRFGFENKRDVEVALQALKETNLLKLADRKVNTLSGGERQRVMIARALAQEADILFLDEPTAHMDINYQVETLCLLRRLNIEKRKTVIVVLHELNLASEFCDRLIMLYDGKIYADGAPEEVVTAENVESVYGVGVAVRRHPTSGRPYVLSLGSKAMASRFKSADSCRKGRVHVICGGGSGGPVFSRLLEAGCEVTAGVINIGDADQESAETLGIEYVEEAPYSPISEVAEQANLEFVERADAVVLTDVPFGVGNLPNLRCALCAIDMGKPVAIIGTPDRFSERDFANGKALDGLWKLVDRGAALLGSVDELYAWVTVNVQSQGNIRG